MSEEETITGCGLTPKQKAEWEATASFMVWTCPGFRHIFYKLLVHNDSGYDALPSRDVPIAATDGQNIIINPDTFFEHNLPERGFIMAHEIVHNVYSDVEFVAACAARGVVPMEDGTTLPYRAETMNKAMDYRINPLLVDSGIGTAPKNICLDPSIATADTSRLAAYKNVYEDEENGGRKTGKHRAIGKILKPGATTGGKAGRSTEQWAVEIAQAQTLETMNAQGKGMGNSLKKFFKSILEPKVSWTDYIQSVLRRFTGSGSYNWKKPDRRLIIHDIYAPSRSGNQCGWIVCWGDTSGSCIADVNKYLPELKSIIEDCKPARLTVVWCDDGVQRVDELDDAQDLETVKGEGAPGGGGTSVDPVFQWIADEMETPEVFIGFTDGYVTFPAQAPPIPVIIWAMLTDQKAPWGENVSIKGDQK